MHMNKNKHTLTHPNTQSTRMRARTRLTRGSCPRGEKLMYDLKASRLPLFSPHAQVSNEHFPARQVHQVANPAME
eukprot:101277-Rhodomonas_salina.1